MKVAQQEEVMRKSINSKSAGGHISKKNYSQTEFGKRFLIRLYNDAVEKDDKRMVKFCKEIFDVYNKYEINSHIKRPNHE